MITIEIDDLSSNEVILLLQEHLNDMYATSPPDSVHALDKASLQSPDITFWCARKISQPVGCIALKALDDRTAEIKSMRVSNAERQQGIASQLLRHLMAVAVSRGYEQLYLETGAQDFFKPARCFYEKFGFQYCEPFADYELDECSVFMMRDLR